jgi:predicted nucleic acid-binding protein
VAWEDLEAAIEPGAGIVVDTSAILAYLDGTERVSGLAAGVFDRLVAPGRNIAVVSSISVTEALVRPMRAGSRSAIAIVETFFGTFPNLTVEPIGYEVAREAATIRAATALPTPDAFVLATSAVTEHAIVVANDAAWQAAIGRASLAVRLVHLDGFA